MQHISYILQDEYAHLLQQKKNLEMKYHEQSKRKRESCEQWAETRHDNADYEDAEYQQKLIVSRISDINTVIRNAKILLTEAISNNNHICIWSHVRLLIDENICDYIIWWHPTIPWRVSYLSPLGKVLMKQKIWDKICFAHNNKQKEITILSIT